MLGVAGPGFDPASGQVDVWASPQQGWVLYTSGGYLWHAARINEVHEKVTASMRDIRMSVHTVRHRSLAHMLSCTLRFCRRVQLTRALLKRREECVAPTPATHAISTLLKAGESVFQPFLLTETVIHVLREAHSLFWRRNTVWNAFRPAFNASG